jgi:hypothetical protein
VIRYTILEHCGGVGLGQSSVAILHSRFTNCVNPPLTDHSSKIREAAVFFYWGAMSEMTWVCSDNRFECPAGAGVHFDLNGMDRPIALETTAYFERNAFSGKGGIEVERDNWSSWESGPTYIRDNTFTSTVALWVHDAKHLQFVGNSVSGGKVPIRMLGPVWPGDISDNTFTGNRGVIQGSGVRIGIHHNTFDGNSGTLFDLNYMEDSCRIFANRVTNQADTLFVIGGNSRSTGSISGNSFECANAGWLVHCLESFGTSLSANLSNNYWDGLTEAQVRAKVTDGASNPLLGQVLIAPVLSSAPADVGVRQ